MASSFLRFLDHTQRRTTVGRTSLDEWSARRRDLYLTTHNTYNRQTSMPPVGFEPTISAGERPQTYALDRAATGTGDNSRLCICNITINTWHKILETNLSNGKKKIMFVFHLSFLVKNVCNQGKTLCSPCILVSSCGRCTGKSSV